MSNKSYLACIDVGTTGCRTIIFSDEGDLITQAYEEYSSIFLSPTWIDHDPYTWIHAARNTFKNAARQFTGRPGTIAAIAVISQRATFTPVDLKGRPLANAMLWQDKRAIHQTEFIDRRFGKGPIYRKTGLRLDPYFSLPKLLWLKENHPDIFNQAHKFLAVHDLVIHHLTGEFVTDWTQASRTMLFNIETLEWDAEICEEFGIPPDKLPRAVAPGTVVGRLRKSLLAELEIGGHIPVVAVGGDQQAAAIGLGVIGPHLMCVNTGTGSFILAHSDQPAFDEQQRVLCTASAVAGKWLMEAGIFTSGSVYRWFRDNLSELQKRTAKKLGLDAYEILNHEIRDTKPGADGVVWLPHFAGSAAPHWNPNAKGLIFGLSLGHQRSSIIRALLEGLALEINKNIKIIEDLIGDMQEIRVSGGVTRSTRFNQIQADVYGKPVIRALSEESSALGAVILAATSIGMFPDIKSAAAGLIKFDRRNKYAPNESAHRLYGKMAELNDALYRALHTGRIYDTSHEIMGLLGG